MIVSTKNENELNLISSKPVEKESGKDHLMRTSNKVIEPSKGKEEDGKLVGKAENNLE